MGSCHLQFRRAHTGEAPLQAVAQSAARKGRMLVALWREARLTQRLEVGCKICRGGMCDGVYQAREPANVDLTTATATIIIFS